MTREQRNTLYLQIDYLTRIKDTFDRDLCEILHGIVANLPVTDAAETTPPMPPAVKRLVDAAVDLLEQADEWNSIARGEGLGPDDTTTGPTRSAIAAVRALYRSEP